MKHLPKLLAPLSLVSIFGLSGIAWLHTPSLHQTMCAVADNTAGASEQKQIEDKVYFVGCGGLF